MNKNIKDEIAKLEYYMMELDEAMTETEAWIELKKFDLRFQQSEMKRTIKEVIELKEKTQYNNKRNKLCTD